MLLEIQKVGSAFDKKKKKEKRIGHCQSIGPNTNDPSVFMFSTYPSLLTQIEHLFWGVT